MPKKCRICKKQVIGRSDKVFCSISCKNTYYIRLKKNTQTAAHHIDKILHHNRSVLEEIMGKRTTPKKISRLILDRKNFNYDYFTGFYLNAKNQTIHHVYDYSWAISSDQEFSVYRNEKLKP